MPLCDYALDDVGDGRALMDTKDEHKSEVALQIALPEPIPMTFPHELERSEDDYRRRRTLCSGRMCLSTAVQAARRFAASIVDVGDGAACTYEDRHLRLHQAEYKRTFDLRRGTCGNRYHEASQGPAKGGRVDSARRGPGPWIVDRGHFLGTRGRERMSDKLRVVVEENADSREVCGEYSWGIGILSVLLLGAMRWLQCGSADNESGCVP